MKRPALLLALFATPLACDVEPAGLVPQPVDVNVVGSATVAFDNLRLVAMVEGEDGALAFGPDVAITSTGTPVTIELTHTPDLGASPQQFPLRLTSDGQGLLVSRVRLIAYLDHDRSGSYQDGQSLFGPDQPLGIEQYWRGVASLPDPEAQVGLLSPEAAAGLYDATGGRFSGFVPVQLGGGGELAPDTSGDPFEVDTSRLSIVNADLACRRELRNTTDPEPVIRLWVDRALDPSATCGLDIADCRPVDTSTLTPPALPEGEPVNPFVATHAQCRRRAGLELLVLETRRVRCHPMTCACFDAVDVEAVATSTSAPPAWWPCGDTVDPCPSTLPLYRVDPECFPMDEEDEDE